MKVEISKEQTFTPISITITVERPEELVDLLIRHYPSSNRQIFKDRAYDILKNPALMAIECGTDLHEKLWDLAKEAGLLKV